MRCTERIIGRFAALGEPRQPILHPQGADTIAPSGQDFMRVTLVPHVPDDLVPGGIEHRMQGDGQFHHAQPGPQMPACHRHGGNRFGPHFIGQSAQFGVGQPLHVRRQMHAVEEWGQGAVWHGFHFLRLITKCAASRRVSASDA